MLQALEPVSPDREERQRGTRPDAVVFAWLLGLPTQMDSSAAASAVLDVTRHQVNLLTPYQRIVVKELAKLIRQDEPGWLSGSADRRLRRARRKPHFLMQNRRRLTNNRMKKFVCLPGGLDNNPTPP